MMSDRLESKKVTLEEVLRLKRAERPDPLFWAEFEQQLRAKQLAAIVERRPWWHLDLAGVSSGFSRLRVPLGATAVLALTIISIQEFRTPGIVVDRVVAGYEGALSDVIEPADVVDLASGPQNFDLSSAGTTVAAVGLPESVVATDPTVLLAHVGPVDPGVARSRVLWLDEIGARQGDRWALPSSDLFAQFAGLRSTQLVLNDPMTASPRGLPSLRQDGRSDGLVDPLTQVTAPSEPRRARLAALVAPVGMKSTSRNSSPDRVRDRMISRLSEDELYNSASRVGVAKGGLSLNF